MARCYVGEISVVLAERRSDLDLTVPQVIRMLGLTGREAYSAAHTLRAIERGETTSSKYLPGILRVLGLTVCYVTSLPEGGVK